MITLCDDCEYTTTIANLMETLSAMEKFLLRIWIAGSELPFIYNQDHNLFFLQESIRIERNDVVEYVFYDTISNVRVINES